MSRRMIGGNPAQSAPSRPPTALWMMAPWCALAAGLLELVMLFWDRWHGRSIRMSREFFWLTPAADLLLFLVVAGFLTLVALTRRRTVNLPIAAAVLVAVVAFSILPHLHWAAWWAIVALAVGLGVLAGRLVRRFEPGTIWFVRMTLPVLAVLTVVAAASGRVRLGRDQGRAVAATVARPKAPNVLVIIWDAVRASELSLYGYPRRTTPRLDAFAARGVTFDQAQGTASYTLPSHASLFTGRWPHQLSVNWTVWLDRSVPTLAEELGRRGYRTGAFSANHAYVSWEFGVLRGFQRIDDYALSPIDVARTAGLVHWLLGFKSIRTLIGLHDKPGRRSAENIRTHFLDWLDGSDDDRPFFAFLNIFDAHDPYLPPAPFDTLFGWPPGADDRERARARDLATQRPLDLTPDEVARVRDQYDGAIAGMDHSLGRLLDALDKRGQLDSTMVIIASDHGEAFSEHGMFGHGNSLYVEELRTPLVIVMPGTVPAGVRVSGVASLRDVPATIGDLLGNLGPSSLLPGRSRARLWAGGPPVQSDTVIAEIDWLPREGEAWFPVRRGNVRSITTWPYHLITTGTDVELYDLAADSGQRHSLARRPEFAALRDSLVSALGRWRQGAVPAKR